MDSEFLKNTVGDALTRGCAATAAVRPADSLAYLAEWLDKYAKNETIKERLCADKAAAEDSAATEKAEAAATSAREQDVRSAQAVAIDGLSALVDDPFVLFAKVAEIVEAGTDAGMVYIGILKTDEPQLLELAEDDDGEDAPEPEDVGEEPEPEAQMEEEGVAHDPFNYKAKHIRYTCSSLGAEFMVGKELRRPSANEEDCALNDKPGVTFAIIDQGVPVIDIPNVLYKVDQMKFFKRLPHVGAYYAQALANAASGEVKALLCADTTITLGEGKPFTLADKQFMSDVADKVSKCLAAMDATLVEYAARAIDAHSPPPAPAKGDNNATPAEEEFPSAEEEVGEEVGETIPVERAPATQLEKAKAAFRDVAAAVEATREDSLTLLKLYQSAPPATSALLRGVVALLSNSTIIVDALEWPELRAKVNDDFFNAIAAFDASTDLPSDEVAGILRRSYVNLKTRDLWKESPLGEPLRDYVIKARAVMKLATIDNAAEMEAGTAVASLVRDESGAHEEPLSEQVDS